MGERGRGKYSLVRKRVTKSILNKAIIQMKRKVQISSDGHIIIIKYLMPSTPLLQPAPQGGSHF